MTQYFPKFSHFSVVSGFVLTTLAQAAFAAPVNYSLVTDKSEVTWTGKKEIGDSHTGTIKIASGMVTIEGTEIKAAEIVIDMDSIVNTDVKDPGYNKKLVDHLKNEDFFKVSEFKTATFKATKPAKIAGGKATLTGKLEIRGKSVDASIPLTGIKNAADSATAEGKMSFDRTNFDVKYNSSSFPDLFKIAKDKVIKNEVDLSFKLAAAKK